jgi:NAD/NADP transhydrogenase alpha subunit
LTGNVTLANPSTEVVGQSGFIVCIQDGTGSRTLSLGTDYETAGGAGITLSTAASATDIIPYVVAASGRILLGTPQLAFS